MTFLFYTGYATEIFNKSPLEQFEVTNIISLQFPIFGYFSITLTNLALYSIIILILTFKIPLTILSSNILNKIIFLK